MLGHDELRALALAARNDPRALCRSLIDAANAAGGKDNASVIAVVCGDQTRSVAVASMLQHAGRDARLVMGGMVDWLERGYPTEKQARAPA